MPNYQIALQKAWQVLYNCTTPHGILASPQEHDNYQRVWARDSIIAGIAGVIGKDETVVNGLVQSIITLKSSQAANGQIPSNVGLGASKTVSFGSLAGRVDATTWYIIGACIAIIHTQNDEFKKEWKTSIYNALQLLTAWEYNQRGLLYTPLGGNWADEYISEGYNLYDQCLRLWALRLVAHLYNDDSIGEQSLLLTKLIKINYYKNSTTEPNLYHQVAFEKAEPKPYFWFQFGPQGYDTRWDMAANALVLLLDLHPEPDAINKYLEDLAASRNNWMLPAFHPIIEEQDYEWQLLIRNYNYSFKNKPHHFHNGGVWPVFMGLLGLGLVRNNNKHTAQSMLSALVQALEFEEEPFSFHEYWSGDHLIAGGVSPLAYTASGTIFLVLSCQNTATVVSTLKKLCL